MSNLQPNSNTFMSEREHTSRYKRETALREVEKMEKSRKRLVKTGSTYAHTHRDRNTPSTSA